jgi:hypothetical protein
VWIAAELAMLRAASWLHAVYGALGVAMLGLAVRAAWRTRLPRHRWVIAVTAAEAAGYLAPAGCSWPMRWRSSPGAASARWRSRGAWRGPAAAEPRLHSPGIHSPE